LREDQTLTVRGTSTSSDQVIRIPKEEAHRVAVPYQSRVIREEAAIQDSCMSEQAKYVHKKKKKKPEEMTLL